MLLTRVCLSGQNGTLAVVVSSVYVPSLLCRGGSHGFSKVLFCIPHLPYSCPACFCASMCKSALEQFTVVVVVRSDGAGPDDLEKDDDEDEVPAVRLGRDAERETSQSVGDSAAGFAPSHSGQCDSTGPSTEGQSC